VIEIIIYIHYFGTSYDNCIDSWIVKFYIHYCEHKTHLPFQFGSHILLLQLHKFVTYNTIAAIATIFQYDENFN